MCPVRWHRPLLAGLARLRRDQRGVVLIYATVVLAAIFGMGGLAIDGGRLMSLHSDMQSFADHAALAAAGELDGSAGAIARATTAANNFVADTQKFATGGPDGLAIDGIRFLHSLPPSDDEPITADYETTDDADARFVEVTIGPLQTDNILMAGLVLAGIAPDMDGEAMATAVAGFTQFACDITPLMICNPDEPVGNEDALFPYTPLLGQQIRLKMGGSGAGYVPGDFGLLDAAIDPNGPCPVNEGAASLACAMGAVEGVTQCIETSGANVRPGELAAAFAAGVNVRFDMFTGIMGSRRNSSEFQSAPNVTKGFIGRGGGACPNQFDPAPAAPDNTIPLPRDGCFIPDPGTCRAQRFGGSSTASITWDVNTYWATNHGGAPPQAFTSRWDLYQYELANGIADKSPTGENGNPQCNAPTPGGPADTAERRTVIAAVINCQANGVQGNASDVPVLTYIKLFLTEPAGNHPGWDAFPDITTNANDLWVEVVEEVEGDGGVDDEGFIHDFVQLYR